MLVKLRTHVCMFGVLMSSNLALADTVEWGGFFSTGTAWTDSKVPYRSVTYDIEKKPQVADSTLLGLNISKKLTNEWRFAGQIISRAAQADSAAKIDWAFVTYNPTPQYEIVFGKLIAPIWLSSKYLEVGQAYPWVDPPEEVYSMLFLKAFNGASLVYHLAIDHAVIDATIYGGDVYYEGEPSSPSATSKLRVNNMHGAELAWRYENTLARIAFNQGAYNFNLSPELRFGEHRVTILNAGIKSENAGYLFMAEYGHGIDRDRDHYQSLAKRLISESQTAAPEEQATILSRGVTLQTYVGGNSAVYALLGKQLFDSLLMHFTYAEVWQMFNPRDSGDMKSWALGWNWDLNTDSVFKLDVKFVDVPANSRGLFRTTTAAEDAMVYRIGYSLIF